MKFNEAKCNIQRGFKKHETGIYTGLGIVFGIVAVVDALHAGAKAKEAKEEVDEMIFDREDDGEKVTTLEKIKLYTKYVGPTVARPIALELGSVFCVAKSDQKHRQKEMAGLAMIDILTKEKSQIIDKVKELGGEKEVKKLQESMSQDAANKVPDQRMIVNTTWGNTLIFDPLSGTYFYSDLDYIRRAEKRICEQMWRGNEMYFECNQWLDELDIPQNEVWGNMMGWNVNSGFGVKGFDAMVTPDGGVCHTIVYEATPIPEPWCLDDRSDGFRYW